MLGKTAQAPQAGRRDRPPEHDRVRDPKRVHRLAGRVPRLEHSRDQLARRRGAWQIAASPLWLQAETIPNELSVVAQRKQDLRRPRAAAEITGDQTEFARGQPFATGITVTRLKSRHPILRP